MNKTLLRLTALSAIGAGTVIAWLAFRPAPSDAGYLRLSGNIEITDAQVSFEIPGRVEERLVSEGDQVNVGQVVARLDAAELEQEVALRRAELAAARAELAELEAGYRSEEIAQARANLGARQAELERADADRRRQQYLFENDVISAMEFDAVRTAHEAAEQRVREADERLGLLRAGPRPETIDQARARLERAEQALALSATRFGYATLTSPLSGHVLSDNVEPGEYVAPGTPVVTAGDLEYVWLRAYVEETDLGRIRLGQPVRVSTDTFPDQRYDGRISFISSEAEFTPKNVQTQKERVKLVYRVKVEIANPRFELRPGMPADAVIDLSGSEE